jgi:alkylhydroperoxidase family enzyme
MTKKGRKKLVKNLNKDDLIRLKSPRVYPLNEIEYVQELISTRFATNRVKFDEEVDVESDWNEPVLSTIKEMKGSISFYLNPISSYLKLEEQGLDINSINIKNFEEPIKDFIKKKGTIFNLRATLMRHKDLFLRWGLFANQVFVHSDIPPREKEIIILRAAWLCRSEYEWEHHLFGGKRAGLTEADIKRIKEGSDADGWEPFEAALLRAVEELYLDNFIKDTTWRILGERFEPNQLIEIIFIVGYYSLLASALNTLGVQLEEIYKNKIK